MIQQPVPIGPAGASTDDRPSTAAADGKRDRLLVLGLLAPALAVLALLFAYPVAVGILQSFSQPRWGWDNYVWFFGSDVNRAMLWRTVGVAVLTTVITLLIAYPYAYLMTLVGPRMRVLLLALAVLPFWISALIRTFAWFVILQDTGTLNKGLDVLGLGPVHLIRTPAGVLIGMVQVLLPFMVLPLYNVIRTIDRRLLQAAESAGARPSVAFFTVYVPLSLPGVAAGSIVVFISALGFYIFPALLGSPQEALIAQAIYDQTARSLNFGRSGVMGVVLLGVVAAVLGAVALASSLRNRANR
jgi:putative spermidine/putrescine transport system permease protein